MSNYEITTYTSPLLREKYYSFLHASGLRIYVFPKKLTSTYALFGTRYGSTDNIFSTDGGKTFTEVPDGIAHFLEHKLFANEDGSDSFEHFSAIGADANAYTSFSKTAYLFSCTENFEAALGELLDFVTHPYFTDTSVKKERGIIAQEIKMYDDHPSESCYYGMLRGLYENHSVKRNICGSVESINKITPKLLYDCYGAFYNLSNMLLVVCGDVDVEDVMRMADEHLPSAAVPSALTRGADAEESPAAHLARVERKMKVAKPIFNIGIKDTDIPSNARQRLLKDAAMSILDEMIFARAGKLYSEMFEEGLISPDLSYGYTMTESFAFNSIAGESKDPEAVLNRIKSHIRSLEESGLSKEDFERGKRVMYAEFVKEFDSTEGIANNLFTFAAEGFDVFEYADLISGVSFDFVTELFKKSFHDEYFTLSTVRPLDSADNN
ncbi:MAG: insulinase family protein [Clostridia bacterium]|nr:insulinase family protein [Clostridia bacterium]